MKKCTGKIYKINGKKFCVGEKNKKNRTNKSKKKNTLLKGGKWSWGSKAPSPNVLDNSWKGLPEPQKTEDIKDIVEKSLENGNLVKLFLSTPTPDMIPICIQSPNSSKPIIVVNENDEIIKRNSIEIKKSFVLCIGEQYYQCGDATKDRIILDPTYKGYPITLDVTGEMYQSQSTQSYCIKIDEKPYTVYKQTMVYKIGDKSYIVELK
jgi:hypothetical protein